MMILSGQLDLEAGKRICDAATRTLEAWLQIAQRFYQLRPNSMDFEHFGILMLKGSEIKVGSDLIYENITKEIRNDFLTGEVRTDIAVRSFTDDDITIRSAAVIYNQNKLNLEILRQFYHMSAQGNNEDPGGANGHVDETKQRLKRACKKKFRVLCGE